MKNPRLPSKRYVGLASDENFIRSCVGEPHEAQRSVPIARWDFELILRAVVIVAGFCFRNRSKCPETASPRCRSAAVFFVRCSRSYQDALHARPIKSRCPGGDPEARTDDICFQGPGSPRWFAFKCTYVRLEDFCRQDCQRTAHECD